MGALPNGSHEYLAAGITTVCDAQVTQRELTAYREARRRGELGIRVVCMPLSHQLDAFLATGIAGRFGDDRLAIGPMKFYPDGALSGDTACFRTPYGENHELPGLLYHDPEELTSLVGRAQADGWQVGIHAQGDRAIEMSLDAIEAGARGNDGRHRLEHAGTPTISCRASPASASSPSASRAISTTSAIRSSERSATAPTACFPCGTS